MSILTKIMIGFGAFITAGFSIAFVTAYNSTASNESVQMLAIYLIAGIVLLTSGAIIREIQKTKKVKVTQ